MDNIFPEESMPRFIIGAPEMFRNKNWSTIDEALSLDSDDNPESIAIIDGNGARQILGYMAVSKMPDDMIRKHLGKLAFFINFSSFINLMSVKFTSVYCAPVDKRTERLLRINVLTPELKYLISKMTIEEINGLLDYLGKNFRALGLDIGLEIINRIYDAAMIPRESLLLILALCHY